MSKAPVMELVRHGRNRHSHATGALLVGYAAPSFVGEIVPGSPWIVWFEPSTPWGDRCG
jgi:hypothetical protein